MKRACGILFLLATAASAQEPALPEGLRGAGQPSLPAGLESAGEPALPAGLGSSDAPSLPAGLGGESSVSELEVLDGETKAGDFSWDFRGFAEGHVGAWTQDNPVDADLPVAEARVQLNFSAHYKRLSAQATFDVVGDPFAVDQFPDLRDGRGVIDLRELWLSAPLGDWADVKAGRQIATWGTGDYLFINDLFPKDWRSFFLGRDDDYLKAPMDALRVNFYTDIVNLDVVYTPFFAYDRFVDGERLSYYDARRGAIAGEGSEVNPDRPGGGEVAARAHRLVGDIELAAYFYHGYWKSPAGQSPAGQPTFPELTVAGASARKPLWGGIANAEFGYYHSGDDPGGDNPLVNNSEFRGLLGFERELAQEFTGSLQWYVEHMIDYDRYRGGLPAGAPERDETRHLLTLRLTKLLMMQNLELSLFTFYSPTDNDAYLRPSVSYKINDQWEATLGGNFFLGQDEFTFFSQFQDNSNVYATIRYNF